MKPMRTINRIFLICFFSFFAQASQAFSLLEWLGFKKEEVAEPSKVMDSETKPKVDDAVRANSAKSNISLGDINTVLDMDELKLIFANLPVEKRKEVLSDPAVFAELVKQQLALKSVLKAIMANKLHENIGSQFLMQKSAENTLREIYVNRLISEKIPSDFPSDEQIITFYKENEDKFTVSQRMHLWQIFFPFENDQDIKAIKALEKQVESVRKSIEEGKLEFSEAAEQHSKHIPSRRNGGYMGLLKIDDIIPAIRDRVSELEENALSKPIKTENGIHIVKRGSLVDAQKLTLEQSRGQIRNALRQEASKRLRLAIVEQAKKSYPIEIEDKKIEEWRLKLRTNL